MNHSRHSSLCIVNCAVCIVLAVASARADEYTRVVTFTASGYAGSSTLTNFPVLVRLSNGSPSGFSYANCASGGSDIRFADANGNALAFDMETWNPSGESCIWVKLPTMGQGTQFEMRYGGIPTTVNDPTAVWTAFAGVWHMNENSATQTDRAGNGLTATCADGVTYELDDGQVGQALKKSGILSTADFFTAGDSPVRDGSYSVSGWYYWPEAVNTAGTLPLGKGAWGKSGGWYLEHPKNTAFDTMLAVRGGNTLSSRFTVPNCKDGWSYLVVTYDGASLDIHTNGAPAFSWSGSFGQGAHAFVIGNHNGYADETRVMRAAASGDWIAADYAAQTGTLLSYGAAAAETRPAFIPCATSAAYTTASLSVLLATAGDGASSATVSLAYGADPANLPAPTVVASGVTAGQTVTANLTGLSANTTYHYALTAVNDASPARSFTMTGTFTTKTFGVPEIAVRATPGLATSAIAVTVKTPGRGSATCDVFVATGSDPANLAAEVQIGDDVGIGAVVTKTVSNPASPTVVAYRVRVVNANGQEWTGTGTFDTEIKWYFDSKNRRLTNAAGWKIAASQTTFNGVTGYNLDGADCIKAAPKDANDAYLTELDLTGLIDTGLDIICLGGHLFRSNGGLCIPLTKLHLPDTIMKSTDNAFVTTGTILDFEPHEFPDLVSQGTPGVPTALFANPAVSFPNPGYTKYPQQMWQAAGAKAIYLGPGLTAIGNYAIDAKGPTDIYLTGDAVPTTGTGWTRQITGGSAPIRINVPIYSEAWKEYAAVSAAVPTTAQETTYATAFTDGRPIWRVGKASQTPDYNGIYLCKWAPEEYCRNALHVYGNIPAGVVTPAYGKNKYVTQSVVCSAPAAATYEGVDYVCAGYSIEALGDDGWGAPVTNLGANSFTLVRDDETSYRLTWLWEVAGYAIDIASAESGVIGETVFSPEVPASGSYRPGTVVTVTPALGGGWTGAFDHWEGDVPAGHETDNPLVLTMDQAYSLTPVFATSWRAVDGYATTRITDGYWTIKVETSGEEISIPIDAMYNVAQPHPIEMLDLRKPVADGRRIVSLNNYSFRSSTTPSLYDLRLPDTLRQLQMESFTGQPIRSIEPCFPDSLHSFNGNAFGGQTFTHPVYLMSKNLTTLPTIFGTRISNKEFFFGVNLEFFDNWAFDCRNGRPAYLDIHLTGDIVPRTGSNWHGSSGPVRVNVPIYSEVWKRYLAEEADDPTSAQQTAYDATFTDGRTLLKVGRTGQSPDYGGVYFCKWSPECYCSNALWVTGNLEIGDVSPAYGINEGAAQSVACAASATASHNGGDYVCAGYVLETMGADGWGVPVTNRNVSSFTLVRDGATTYRVTWLWAEAGFALELNTAPAYPPSGLTYGEIAVSPANSGPYAPGTTVTLTAPATGSGDWTDARFDHWIGDVPAGHERDNPLVVTMDQARSLTPFYAANWRAVPGYATTRITDGYFTLKCTTADNEITLGYSCGVVTGGVDVLDLRKPVADGRAITALKDYTFSPNSGSTMYPFKTLVFPDTLKSISGNTSLGGGLLGKTGVRKLVNTFPNSLAVFTGGMHGLTANWEGGPVYLLNKNLTAVPGQIFGGYSGGHAYHLGVNIASIPNYAFDCYSGGQPVSVYLYGETKPTFGGGDWHRSASQTRLVVPRSSAVWKEWIAANTTIPTAAQTNTYNTVFADREPREKLVGIGKNVDCQYNVYICTWSSPAAESRRTIIFLR